MSQYLSCLVHSASRLALSTLLLANIFLWPIHTGLGQSDKLGKAAGAIKQVGGAVHKVDLDWNEAVLFELPNFESRPGKLEVRVRLDPKKSYADFDLKTLHRRLAIMGPESGRAFIRSIALGEKLGVVIRFSYLSFKNSRMEGHHVCLLRGAAHLEKPWNNIYTSTNIILFRKDVYAHPPGVSFSNRNPFNQLSGPLADKLQMQFILANSPTEREEPKWWTFSEFSVPQFVTLYGKGTTLAVWSNGVRRELVAKNDDPRQNVLYLPDQGIDLRKIAQTHDGTPGTLVTAPQKAPPPPAKKSSLRPGAQAGIGQAVHDATTVRLPNMVGVYRQIGLADVEVIIGQNDGNRSRFACKIPQMNLIGKGTIAQDGTIVASFGPPDSGGNEFGQLGALTKVKGKITVIDSDHVVQRIEWENGVIYQRK